jgi:hypothetical protein
MNDAEPLVASARGSWRTTQVHFPKVRWCDGAVRLQLHRPVDVRFGMKKQKFRSIH